MIELPKTIRPARIDEVPNDAKTLEKLQKIDHANLIEGYTLRLIDQNNESHTAAPYSFYSEININNSRLWNMITALAELLPDPLFLILTYSEAEPDYCEIGDKNKLMAYLKKFKTELIADVFLEWGMVYQDKETLVELLISDSKYVKFWGINLLKFKSMMTNFNLHQIDNLEFIDEYPTIRTPLRSLDKSTKDTMDLTYEIK